MFTGTNSLHKGRGILKPTGPKKLAEGESLHATKPDVRATVCEDGAKGYTNLERSKRRRCSAFLTKNCTIDRRDHQNISPIHKLVCWGAMDKGVVHGKGNNTHNINGRDGAQQ